MEEDGENFQGNPLPSPSSTKKHDREMCSSDSELSPKRSNLGGEGAFDENAETMACDEDFPEDPPPYAEDENAYVDPQQFSEDQHLAYTYQWLSIDSQLFGMHGQIDAIHAGMEQNRLVVENFAQNVQERVDNAMSAYEKAINHEFASAHERMENMSQTMHAEFLKKSQENYERSREEAKNWFSTQGAENSAIWQNIARFHDDKAEKMITTRISDETEKLRDEFQVVIKAQVSQMEAMMRRELSSALNTYHEKLEKSLESRLVGHQNAIESLHVKTSQNVGALQKGIGVCLEKCQKLENVLSTGVPNPEVGILKGQVQSLSQTLHEETRGKAILEGKISEKVEHLEKTVGQVHEKVLAVSSNPPSVVYLTNEIPDVHRTFHVSSSSSLPAPALPSQGGGVQLPTLEPLQKKKNILELEPIEAKNDEIGFGMLHLQEALLQCIGGVVAPSGEGGGYVRSKCGRLKRDQIPVQPTTLAS